MFRKPVETAPDNAPIPDLRNIRLRGAIGCSAARTGRAARVLNPDRTTPERAHELPNFKLTEA
jgi:hypothetical protein